MAKLAKAKKEQESTGKSIVRSFLEYVCVLWASILVLTLPLYMKDGYYQIGAAKYEAYANIVVYGMPILLILVVLYAIFSKKERKETREIKCIIKEEMSIIDWFMVAYLLCALLSYLCSGMIKDAFWGYDGWNMGFFSQFSFVVLYFVLSRFLKDSPIVLSLLCASAFYVFVVGILHRLMIDPIGVYDNLSQQYKNLFLSTLGQASWYSSFMTVLVPIGIFGHWYFKHYMVRIINGVFLFAGFATLVTQNTDSAYFGFVAAMLVVYYASADNAKKMRRLCEIALMFLLAAKFMCFLLKIHPNEGMEWDSISHMLVFDNWIWILVAICVVLIIVFAIFDRKESYPRKAMMITRNVIFGFVAGLVLLWAIVLVAGTKGWLPESIAAACFKIPYLTWNANWGNGRGFTWGFTAKMLGEMNIKNMLIGVGPDCYAAYAHGNYAELIQTKWGNSVLTNAHNEWMNAIVNYGWIGGTMYIGIFISALVRFMKRGANKPLVLGFAAAIAAYMAHNLFCYQQVLCTPIIFLFMAIGEYQLRKKVE